MDLLIRRLLGLLGSIGLIVLITAATAGGAAARLSANNVWGLPSGAYPRRAPLGWVLVVHGGGWQVVGHAVVTATEPEANFFRRHGWGTYNIDYRPRYRSLADVISAYDILRLHAGPHARICAWGGSAEGQLVLMLAGLRPSLECVITEGAPTDLLTFPKELASAPAWHLADDRTVVGVSHVDPDGVRAQPPLVVEPGTTRRKNSSAAAARSQHSRRAGPPGPDARHASSRTQAHNHDAAPRRNGPLYACRHNTSRAQELGTRRACAAQLYRARASLSAPSGLLEQRRRAGGIRTRSPSGPCAIPSATRSTRGVGGRAHAPPLRRRDPTVRGRAPVSPSTPSPSRRTAPRPARGRWRPARGCQPHADGRIQREARLEATPVATVHQPNRRSACSPACSPVHDPCVRSPAPPQLGGCDLGDRRPA